VSTAKRPNILIFQNDQEQGAVVGPGHPCSTPTVDRLAREGVRFSQAYTVAAHCCPSRATFMSGLYPSRHGIYNNVLNTAAIHTSLNDGVTLFSEVLADAGYALAYAGKWHVCADEGPADRGWVDYGATSIGGRDYNGTTWEGWRERAQTPEPDTPRERGEVLRPGWGRLKLYGTGETSDEARPYTRGDHEIVQAGLRALGDLTAGERPWCLYIGPNGPHDPYIIPEHYANMYDPDEVELPVNWRDDMQDKPRVYQRQRQLWDQFTEREYREAVAHYWGYCTMQDDLLGLVLGALDATGQAENTLVLFSSDHGDYAGAHGLFAKGVAAFDECYRVPCIMRWPAGIADPGREVSALVTHADMAPTFVGLAGGVMPACSGRSLTPFLHGDTPVDWPDAIYTQLNGVELYYSQRVVRTHRWKYVYNGYDLDELYDLARDRACMLNRAADPAYDAVVREMCERMWRHAYREDDMACNPYMTVALAPYGPMVGLRGMVD
jgi:arylsulfatase A-like enzyme